MADGKTGRVDLLALGFAEKLARAAELNLGIPVWENIRPAAERFVGERLPDTPFTVESVCERLGVFKGKRK